MASGAALTKAAARSASLSSVASKPPATTTRFFPSTTPLSRNSSKNASTAVEFRAEGKQDAEPVRAAVFLRVRRERPRRRRASKQRDELAAFHSITKALPMPVSIARPPG